MEMTRDISADIQIWRKFKRLHFHVQHKASSINSYVFFYLHNVQIEADPPTHPSICTIKRKKYVRL